MKKRIFALILALTLLLPVTLTAGAVDTVMECRLRGTYFNSLGEAMKLYEDGDVIELLMELHRCCRMPYGIEVRVRGVDGVQVYDDLFYAYTHQEIWHRVEGDIHIFKLVELEPDPALPEITVEEGTVPYGHMGFTGVYPWPGETARAEASIYPGCELASFTVLDSEFNEIPSWPAGTAASGGIVYYEFVLPVENLPVKIYAAIRPAGWTDDDCPSESFADVPADAWYHMAVDELVNRGAVSGKSADSFAPYDSLTRAEAVSILYRFMGSPAVDYSPVFTDVPEGQWYTGPIMWAAGEGIVSGIGGGLFAPDALLNWEQLWVMLLRMSGDEYDFFRLDTEEAVRTGAVSAFAADALTWVLDNGIYADDPIHGHAVPTRAEAAVTVYLYLQYQQKLAANADSTSPSAE